MQPGTELSAIAYPPLVCTQIQVPVRARRPIARPRLTERVGVTPVTLVCGPAGSGKTTLVSDWASRADRPVGWVSLEREDDDPYRLWRAVLASLRAAGAVPAGSTLDQLQPSVSDSREFSPLLINALAELPAAAVLVLDDVHVLRTRPVRDQLGFLLLHVPATLRVVLASRSDPVLPLHVLRVRTLLSEVRTDALAFDRREAASLLSAHGLDLDEASIATLQARTEGWAAGLRMAALSLQREHDPTAFVSRFAGDDRFVGDYLMAEVLDRLPGPDRDFLLDAAGVDSICGALAETLTDVPDGDEMLERLADTTGFMHRVPGRPGWWRFHRLFGELLRARLRHQHADRERVAHRRAAAWYADNGLVLDALRHAGAGHDCAQLTGLLAEHWRELFAAGHRLALSAALNAIPNDVINGHPELSVAATCVRFDVADIERAREHLAHAPAGLTLARLCAARHDGNVIDLDDAGHDPLALVSVGVAALWSFAFERAEHHLGRARIAARATGAGYLELDALAHLALTRVLRDGPAAASEPAREAQVLAGRPAFARTAAAAATDAALAHIAFFEDRLADAEAHLAEALAGPAEPMLRRTLLRLNALVDLAYGRRASSSLTRRPAAGDRHALDAALLARRQLADGDPVGARATLDAVPDSIGETCVAAAMIAVQDTPEGALDLLRASAPPLLGSTRVEALIVEALAHDRLDAPTWATDAMERALQSAEAAGHRSVFLLHPGAHHIVVACIAAGTAHRSLAGEVLAAIENALAPPTQATPPPLADPITARECDILRLLPTTASNREIAAELDVTVNTVKTHLRAIYQKLDASDRRAAVERAHELQLVQRVAR